ncbi:hypothetical protein RB597_002924 [Gaeumannomyces tritici]
MQANDPRPEGDGPDRPLDQPLGLAINGLGLDQLPTPDSTPTNWASRSPVIPVMPDESAIDESPVAGDGTEERDLRVDTEPRTQSVSKDGVRRLSASKMRELAASPESLPVAPIPDRSPVGATLSHPLSASIVETAARPSMADQARAVLQGSLPLEPDRHGRSHRATVSDKPARPAGSPRTLSTPPMSRQKSSKEQPQPQPPAGSRRNSFHPTPRLNGIQIPLNGIQIPPNGVPPSAPPSVSDQTQTPQLLPAETPVESASVPLPPMSVPMFLQLELAGERPSPLYIQHSYANDVPYESSAVKFERLKNFLLLPSFLERTICFGALACLDAWLWTFTILPMRFVIALGVLVKWWGYVVVREARWSIGYVWYGLGRWLRRGRARGSAGEESRSPSRAREASAPSSAVEEPSVQFEARKPAPPLRAPRHRGRRGHRRTKSMPSNLTSFHKADILQGFVILFSCMALMRLDASRMYHFIRAQSAIKLYVIYNGLEVGDRLLSSLGQDIFECLFSTEVLARNHLGRSKVLVPFGMFLLALIYNTCHAITLFYQVITLNVAVNSYNNALLTLLISNQFVEIKSAVFKRFEKENVFQLTCADIVERFQLWLMLLIIAMRNIVEVGFWTIPGAISGGGPDSDDPSFKMPLHSPSVLPASFTALPAWLWSGEVLSPFLIVTGSETVVDWIKHAYINKFNNIKPNFYSRVLDILCKDYYTNAFVTPSLTRRLGLPLLPLSCLFIRASVQTYHMFLATHLPAPLPSSTQTALAEPTSATPSSPAMAASLDRLDTLIRNALGRAVHGLPYVGNESAPTSPSDFATSPKPLVGDWTTDDAIAALTMLTFFFLAFLVLLVLKLLLGMALLRYSRGRYARMRRRELAVAAGRLEPEVFDQKGGKRVGGFGQVEVGDERRAKLYEDDPEGLKKAQATERRNVGKREKSEKDLGRISRYEMVAKRIW